MKNLKLHLLGLAATVLLFSCKKNDLLEEELPATPETEAVASSRASISSWQSAASWEKAEESDASVYSFSLTDASLNADVAEKGLVLVYRKGGSAVSSLPFEDDAASQYWYYQVTDGSLTVSCDVTEKGKAPANDSFQFIAFSSAQLSALEEQGYSKLDLMQLTYDNATALLQ